MNKNLVEIKNVVTKMITSALNLSEDYFAQEDNILFGTSSGFDSTQLLEFILQLEEEFDIIIPDEDLIPANFSSLQAIAEYIYEIQ